MYSIIGVTSFGKKMGCGTAPAIYTRVSEYVGWIESIVWPDEVEKFNSKLIKTHYFQFIIYFHIFHPFFGILIIF